MAEALRPLLHEIAVEIGFKGSLELEADPRLPDGAAQLLWPGGWLELDPSALASRVSDLLAPYGGTATRSPQAEDRTTDEHEPG
jgi:hypothetical protein